MTDTTDRTAVRAFTSYSWSSPTHELWVINLASRLREDGVDVILDKWDLKPGHDSIKFMESMVTDATVTKVMMICDRIYVEKADSRAGGVGTESQIISPEIYRSGAQDKFAALITDDDAEGNAHIPTFYKGRIFFDFRSADKFEDSYEQLLRWLVNRPQHVKPKLGKIPEGSLAAAPVASAVQSRARRAEDGIRQDLPSAPGLVRDFGEGLVAELKALTPIRSDSEPYDETVLNSLDSMRPYLKQFAEVVSVATRFGAGGAVWDRILSATEGVGRLMFRPPERDHWNSASADVFKIVAHEAFLTVIALALREERFEFVDLALRRAYIVGEREGGSGPAASDFTVFRQYVPSLEERKRRLGSNQISLQADILKASHSDESTPSFEELMQADFILFLRFGNLERSSSNWYPLSLVYAAQRFSPFPVFARAESAQFFDRLKLALAVADLDTFRAQLHQLAQSQRVHTMFDFHGLPVGYLSNSENLCRMA